MEGQSEEGIQERRQWREGRENRWCGMAREEALPASAPFCAQQG